MVKKCKRMAVGLACLSMLGMTVGAAPTTIYVTTNGTGNLSGTDWANATNNLQGAIDAIEAGAGNTVWVSNGTYAVGGQAGYPGGGLLTNRVVITKAITVRSANNDPANTIIKGAWDPTSTNGPAAIRCVYMSAGSLIGFTLTHGATVASGSTADISGGGIYSGNALVPVISNCVIAGNSAGQGGGTYYVTVNNCTIASNSAVYGGGSYWSTLNNSTIAYNSVSGTGSEGGGIVFGVVNFCTLVGNSAESGGATYSSTVNNCTIVSNTAVVGGGDRVSVSYNCLIVGNSAIYGGGSYGGTMYNCTVVGNAATTADGIGGGTYAGALTNCIIYFNTAVLYGNNAPYASVDYSCTTSPDPSGTGNTTLNPNFANAAAGDYRVGSNSPCVDTGTNGTWTATYPYDLNGNPRIHNGRVDMGAYEYVGATTYYVATNGAGNGSDWAHATNTIQGAIDRTLPGDTVLVSNGVYEVGNMTNYPATSLLPTRVVINKAITVRSANNDPTNTIIKGAWAPGGTNGPGAVRCVYLGAGSLIGFTVTNGATLTTGDNTSRSQYGGGIYVPSSYGPIVSNCVIAGNAADYGGGGVFYGTVNNCVVAGNFAGTTGGGAMYSTLNYCAIASNSTPVTTGCSAGGVRLGYANYCTIIGNSSYDGGGTVDSPLNNCTIIGNTAVGSAGGSYNGTRNNCTVANNSAGVGGGDRGSISYNCLITGNSAVYGGGSYGGTMYNCTVAGNAATTAGGVGGGTYAGVLTNCIIYFNTAVGYGNNAPYASVGYSCTTSPDPDGPGNTTADPAFVNAGAGNYRLRTGSPCMNTGTNGSWTTTYPYDLDGRPRIRYGQVDMGAYETVLGGAVFGFK